MAALQGSVARLRECGVTGGDLALTALLEAAGFDENRAVNIFLDRHEFAGIDNSWDAAIPSAASVLATEAEASPRAAGVTAPSTASRTRRDRRKKDPGESSAQERVEVQQRSRGQPRQRGGRRLSPAVAVVSCEGEEDVPAGVRYEAGPGESYDVDVLRMQRTHVETGSVRKIRREKKGVWRYDKKGSTWGVFPGYVSVELERIFVTLERRGRPLPVEKAPKVLLEDPQVVTDPIGFSLSSLDGIAQSLHEEGLSPAALGRACELLFSAAEAGGPAEAVRAGALLEVLALRHGLRCGMDHVRRAGLVIGSMRLLQAVLGSAPDLSLAGLDLFDRRYAKANMQDPWRKNCVRCLLARGMRIGSSGHAPHGKLLRKVEVDAAPAWAHRCLDSMMLANPKLPDSIRDRVFTWLGLDPV